MESRITWGEGPFGGTAGYLPGFDKVSTFNISYGTSRDDDGKPYVLGCKLPGYKDRFYVESETAAKKKAEQLFASWITRVGAQFKDEEKPAE